MKESLNYNLGLYNNIPNISKVLTPIEQRKIFNVGDKVFIRYDAKKYFNDIDEKFIGNEATIVHVLTYEKVYGNKSDEIVYDTDRIDIIPDNIEYNKNDLIIFCSNNYIDDEYDVGFFYRCLFTPSLAEPNYKKSKK